MTTSYDSPQLLDYVYDKELVCPCCDSKFTERTVKQKALQVSHVEKGLRSIYKYVDPLMYEIILCPICGYAALTKTFEFLGERSAEAIKNQISLHYVHKSYPKLYTPEIALERFQLCIKCAEVKKVKKSELAYIELKMSWVYRLLKDTQNELLYVENAYKGFVDSMQNERFPIMEFDEQTLTYLLGELCYMLDDKSESRRWFSRLMTRRDINPRIKSKVEDMMELLKESN